MKRCYFYFILFIASVSLHAQVELEYKGSIKDSQTGASLPYVNIGILNKGLGTVSDEEGRFQLVINKSRFQASDTLQISSVGYKTIKMKLKNFVATTGEFISIKMEPETFALNEVVLSAKSLKRKREEIVGFSYRSREKIGYWKGDGALGAELVTRIDLNKRARRLNSFNFYVLENYSDSVLLRVNIYKAGTIYPEVKLLTKNVTQMITKKAGLITVNLKPYNVFVDGDFSVGLELLKIYGADVGLVLSADDLPSTSYRRYTSQDTWKSFRGDAMTFYLNTTVLKDVESVASLKKDRTLQILRNSIELKPVEIISNEALRNISGMAFNNGLPVQNVDVSIKGSYNQTQTDKYGRYNLLARVGDTLKFDYLGLKSVTKAVDDLSMNINVSLSVQIEELDNVTVTQREKIKKTDEELFFEYQSNPDVIKSSFGFLDKKVSGIAMQVVDGSKLNQAAPNLVRAIQNQFSGVYISPARNDGRFYDTEKTDEVIYMRSQGSINNPVPAAYEVDGTLYLQPPLFLEINNIERIAKLSGLAATALHGSQASGGLFIINTKTGNFSPNAISSNSTNNGLVKNNIFRGELLSQEQLRKNAPIYLQAFYNSKTFKEAKEQFDLYSKTYGSSINYFLDAYLYFNKYWKEDNFVEDFIDSRMNLFEDDAFALKGFAYAFDEQKNYQKSNLLYRKIFLLRPNEAQSYRDMANNYILLKEAKKAANLYARYNKLLNEDFLKADVEGIHPIITRELNNFVLQKGGSFLSPSDMSEVASNFSEKGTRLLFEWNDEHADFDLQFVNPEKKFFIWRPVPNNQIENTILKSSSKEYFIDTSLNGKWQVNVNYKGNISGLPTYMKVTVYFDYGTPNESFDVAVYRLGLKNVNQKLFELDPDKFYRVK